ncbi:hypothetical protein AVEN_204031-1 [Araneus ventricosus]|uniref:Uncharacterized protein n=1 Tax=Araneus ventricosus TaxID=182803 RepID=A0A4Y2X9F8_ARAVE|nr:hypothetical protein AVEN_204031-1 [Araneus ventricosus]
MHVAQLGVILFRCGDEITIARWRTCIIVDLISINARWWGNITTGGGVSISRDGDSHELEPDGGVLEHYSTPNQNPNFFQNPKSEFPIPNSDSQIPIRIYIRMEVWWCNTNF